MFGLNKERYKSDDNHFSRLWKLMLVMYLLIDCGYVNDGFGSIIYIKVTFSLASYIDLLNNLTVCCLVICNRRPCYQ